MSNWDHEAALQRALERSVDFIDCQWRTIDSAPKDGSQILVYEPSAGVCVMLWMDGAFREKVSFCTLRNNATHWMPLPEPPEAAGREIK